MYALGEVRCCRRSVEHLTQPSSHPPLVQVLRVAGSFAKLTQLANLKGRKLLILLV